METLRRFVWKLSIFIAVHKIPLFTFREQGKKLNTGCTTASITALNPLMPHRYNRDIHLLLKAVDRLLFTALKRFRYIESGLFLLRSFDMQATRIFQNGNSQAVRIPAEIAYERLDIPLEIERIGDEIRIRPARRSLNGVLKKFARLGADFLPEERTVQDQSERESL